MMQTHLVLKGAAYLGAPDAYADERLARLADAGLQIVIRDTQMCRF